jgi:hypothetical protein
MKRKVSLDSVYKPSEDVVAREIQGEFILVPIASGVGDLEDALYTLNKTGRAIWSKLDGKRAMKDIVKQLCAQFQAPAEEIKKDVVGFISELLKRKMLIEIKCV